MNYTEAEAEGCILVCLAFFILAATVAIVCWAVLPFIHGLGV